MMYLNVFWMPLRRWLMPHDFEPAAQRNLKMRGAFYRPTLEKVIGPNANVMAPLECRRENFRIVVDIGEQHRLIEELHTMRAQMLDVAFGLVRHFADVVEVRHNDGSLARLADAME